MPDWPPETLGPGAFGVLSTAGEGSQIVDMLLTQGQTFNVGGAWPTASMALFVPVVVRARLTVYQLGWQNGTVVSGNTDVGIYDRNGNLVVSAGSTAQATVSVPQFADIADTALAPGLYYLALVADNTTGTYWHGGNSMAVCRAAGMAQMAAAFPLPAAATFAAISGTFGSPLVVGAISGAVI